MKQEGKAPKKKSQFKDVCRRFAKNRPAMAGLVIFVILALIAIFANVLCDESLTVQISADIMQKPSARHWFGTDNLGRDILARCIYGARISLSIGFVSVAISVLIGSFLGAAAGYFGGVIDNVIMRITDMLMCIPSMLLVMAIIAALGISLVNLLIAMTISSVPSYIRLVRASVISLTDMEYVQCARSYGTPSYLIIFRHVLPNAIGPIIITAAGNIAGVILAAAGLSFLGFGVQQPTPEWGAMVSAAKVYLRTAPFMSFFPGIAIVISAMSINLIGDGLRDALDPRLKE